MHSCTANHKAADHSGVTSAKSSLLLLPLQGCRPLSESVYSIDKVAGHSSVVLGLRDAAGRELSPVEALQQELQQVGVANNML
jgi:hypothetical protein